MSENNGQVPEQDQTVVRRISEIGQIPVSETRAAKAVVEAKKIVTIAKAQAAQPRETVVPQPGDEATTTFPTAPNDSPDLARPDVGPSPKTTGEKLMTFKPLFATLAALLLGGVFLFSQNDSGNQAFAIEDIIESFRNATTGRYDWTVKRAGETRTQTITFAPGKIRRESDGRIEIDNWELGRGLRIDRNAGRAETFYFSSMDEIPAADQSKVREMYRLQSNPFDRVIDDLESALNDDVESLGEKTIQGRTVVGHRLKSSTVKTIWTDKKSGAPLSVEIAPFGKSDKLALSNVEFNIDVDDSLFSLEPPAGLRFMEGSKIPPREGEADFISALRLICNSRDGNFPDGISGQGYSDTVQAFFAANNAPDDCFAVQQGLKFPNHVNEAFYAGKGTKSGQSDRPILWYQQGNGYRVIYADFSTKTLDEAPQSENAVRVE